jgi:hypothetical protein
MASGRPPSILLARKHKNLKFNSHIDEGICPFIELNDKSTDCKCLQSPIDSGIVPEMLLRDKSKKISD